MSVVARMDKVVDDFAKRCRWFREPITKGRARVFALQHRLNTRQRNSVLKLKVATYVEIYLRNEMLRLRIFELEKTIGSLHTEFDRLDPSRAVLLQRIRNLESIIESLKRELNTVPS